MEFIYFTSVGFTIKVICIIHFDSSVNFIHVRLYYDLGVDIELIDVSLDVECIN